jgi:hypothetical protein
MLRIPHCLDNRLTVNCEILATCSSTYSPVRTTQDDSRLSAKLVATFADRGVLRSQQGKDCDSKLINCIINYSLIKIIIYCLVTTQNPELRQQKILSSNKTVNQDRTVHSLTVHSRLIITTCLIPAFPSRHISLEFPHENIT